jgi:hypothetical protein
MKKRMEDFMKKLRSLSSLLLSLFMAGAVLMTVACDDSGSRAGGRGGLVTGGEVDITDPTGDSDSNVIAADDTWSVYEGKSAVIPAANLIENDVDNTDSAPLTITSVFDAVAGTVEIDGANLLFTSTGIAGEEASFSYIVENASGDSDEALVVITVNDPPPVIANADTYEVVQGNELIILASSLMDNDEGQGTLSIESVSNAVGGTVALNDDTITFTSTGYAYEPASFEYTVFDDAYGETGTGNVYVSVTPLAPVEGYIYHDETLLNDMMNNYVPPTVEDIFNSWGRFDGNNFYVNKDDPSINSNANAWEFLTDPDRVSMPLNVTPYNGFVSPEGLENYTFEATLSSTSSDNDTIGLIIAFARVDGVNYVLSAQRTKGGTEPKSGWGVTYGTGSTAAAYSGIEWIVDEKSVDGVDGGWSSAQSRVKIERNGDIIKCYTTAWNDTENYQAASEIIIDLSSDERLEKFRGESSYGYSTYSQPDSTYLDIEFNGGMDVSKLMNALTGDVWEYVAGSGWVLSDNTVQDELGFVRQVTNPETGDAYIIKENSIELVESE